MANRGRPTTKNTTSKETKVVENKNAEVKPQVEVKNVPKRIALIDRERLVACRSVVYGKLTHISPTTKIETVWEDYGDVQYISTGEIIASPKKFLTKPWFLIEDYDELVEFLRLQNIYDNLLPLEDIDAFLNKPFKEIETLFNSAPMGMKQTFVGKVRELIDEQKINDIRIVNMIDKTLGTGLREFI